MRFVLLALLVAGCSFDGVVRSLPSVQNCQKVTYTRIGNIVNIEAECQIPMKSDPLLDLPVTP